LASLVNRDLRVSYLWDFDESRTLSPPSHVSLTSLLLGDTPLPFSPNPRIRQPRRLLVLMPDAAVQTASRIQHAR
ncbi:hypothetical protein BaRGS_00000147, partial [Batillaria attramentaria]